MIGAPIKLIICDLSGVFFSTEEPPYVYKFADEHNLPKDEFYKRYMELVDSSETNEISGYDVWNTILAEYNVQGEPEKIISEMLGTKEPHLEMLELARELKKHYTVAYLTNYNKEYWQVIEKNFDMQEWFNWGVVSYQIGYRKPAPEGFLHILKKAGCTPEEAVFMDDSARNLEEAKKLGINAILFTSKEKLIDDLKNLGVLYTNA